MMTKLFPPAKYESQNTNRLFVRKQLFDSVIHPIIATLMSFGTIPKTKFSPIFNSVARHSHTLCSINNGQSVSYVSINEYSNKKC